MNIINYSLEEYFYKIIISKNDIIKTVFNDKPAIMFPENENTEIYWCYESDEERNHDYSVVHDFPMIMYGKFLQKIINE